MSTFADTADPNRAARVKTVAAPVPQIIDNIARDPNVRGAVVVSRDGLLLGSSGQNEDVAEMMGATAAAILALLDRHILALGAGDTCSAQIDFDQDTLLLKDCGEAIITVRAQRTADLTNVKLAMRGAARDIRAWFASLGQ